MPERNPKTPPSRGKIPVAVLGATGSVGQRFVQLLDGHPWFEVHALTGSDRSVGQPYGQACRWILNGRWQMKSLLSFKRGQ